MRRFSIQRLLFPVDPRYNVAPSQNVGIVSADGDGRTMRPATWGLIPTRGGSQRPMINARAETVDTLRSFREAFADRRCLIPADGFYEWQTTPSGAKTPMFIRLADDAPFAFAGLYEPPVEGQADQPPTCTIITTEANALLRPIHERMPVILPPEAESEWLEGDANDALRLLKPYDPEAMTAYPVSRRVNKPANDDPSLIQRVDNEAGTQGDLFG